MAKKDIFKTTDPRELIGKLDPKRLKGIDLQDSANIFVVDTIGRFTKNPDALMVSINKIEDSLGDTFSKYMDTPIGKAILQGRDMVSKGLEAIQKSGVIGPDGRLDFDKLLDVGGNMLDSMGIDTGAIGNYIDKGIAFAKNGIGAVMDVVKMGVEKLRDLGDVLGITKIIDTAKGWFNNAVDFFDSLVPDFVKDLFKNLDFSKIFGDNLTDGIFDKLKDHLGFVTDTLNIEWWWADKSRKLYNYDTLAVMHPMTLKLLGFNDEALETLHPYATALKEHYRDVERVRRTMYGYV